MKIVVFLLILGLSGCLGHDGEVKKPECKQKIDEDNARCIIDQLLNMLEKYLALQGSKSDCADECFWDAASSVMKQMTGASRCHYSAIAWTVAFSVSSHLKKHQKTIMNCIFHQDHEGLKNVGVTPEEMLKAVCKAMSRVMTSHGHNPDNLITEAILNQVPVLRDVERIKKCAENVGFTLNLSIEQRSGKWFVQHKGGQLEVGSWRWAALSPRWPTSKLSSAVSWAMQPLLLEVFLVLLEMFLVAFLKSVAVADPRGPDGGVAHVDSQRSHWATR